MELNHGIYLTSSLTTVSKRSESECKVMDRHANACLIKMRDNLPCNTFVVCVFLLFYLLLDPLRALVTISFNILLLPWHASKHQTDDRHTRRTCGFETCTAPGIHRSCSAIYLLNTCVGMGTCLSLLLDPEHNPDRWSEIVNTAFLFILCVFTVWLLVLGVDSLTAAWPRLAEAEPANKQPLMTKRTTVTTSKPLPVSSVDTIGFAPDDDVVSV